jgi:hypothetical protein
MKFDCRTGVGRRDDGLGDPRVGQAIARAHARRRLAPGVHLAITGFILKAWTNDTRFEMGLLSWVV